MNINDNGFVKFLDQMITEKVQKEIKKEFKKRNIVTAWVGKVVAINNNLIDVKLAADTASDNSNVLTGKKNKTNETLAVGDEVYLYSPHGELSTSYVAIKK